MPTTIGPQVCIDIRQPYLAGQVSVIGPINGNLTVSSVLVTGNTGTTPVLRVGSWDGTTFTSAATIVNGVDGLAATLGTTSTLTTGVGPYVITTLPSTAITNGQYLQYTSTSNTTARVQVFVNATGAVGGFTVNTTPA